MGLRSCTTAITCRARLICRFPARESRCLVWSPEEAELVEGFDHALIDVDLVGAGWLGHDAHSSAAERITTAYKVRGITMKPLAAPTWIRA